MTQYEDLIIFDLKKILKQRRLQVTGNKQTLIMRIRQSDYNPLIVNKSIDTSIDKNNKLFKIIHNAKELLKNRRYDDSINYLSNKWLSMNEYDQRKISSIIKKIELLRDKYNRKIKDKIADKSKKKTQQILNKASKTKKDINKSKYYKKALKYAKYSNDPKLIKRISNKLAKLSSTIN